MNNKNTLLTNAVNQMIINGFDKLESVGCLLDSDVGSVYPMNEDGTPDWSLEISLIDDEVSYEWLDALSEIDYQKIKPFLQK
jgi:hypothetical protein